MSIRNALIEYCEATIKSAEEMLTGKLTLRDIEYRIIVERLKMIAGELKEKLEKLEKRLDEDGFIIVLCNNNAVGKIKSELFENKQQD